MGLNYIGQRGQLSGCIADTHTWRDYLTKQCGINALLCMTDRTHIRPTRSNMVRAIRYMVAHLKRAGGTLFFTYSGHGSQVRNYGHGARRDAESDGKDETLVPLDYARAGQVTDDTLFQLITGELASCRKNARCIIIVL
jgi:hypothetical protein